MISRTKREEERGRRGARRNTKSMLPGLARWAGVGVFVLGAAMACDNGPTEPAGNNEGVLYALIWSKEIPHLVLIKFDAADGTRLGSYPVKDYNSEEMRAVGVNRRNGDVYIALINHFIRMGSEGQFYFDRDWFLTSNYQDTDLLIDAGAKRVWVYENGAFNLHDAETGDLIKTIAPVREGAVSEYDNTLVTSAISIAGTELIKISKDGNELWRKFISSEPRLCECVAVDPKDGTIYVFSTNGREPVADTYFQRITAEGEVLLEKEMTPFLPDEAEVSAIDGTIWATASHVSPDGEVLHVFRGGTYFSLALSRLSNKVYFGFSTKDVRSIKAINTKTYGVVWELPLDNMGWFVGWANP
jgi:hypothetical protein